ncbi:MAG TPA: hypothetical protein VMW72_21500 [Sedimentisphaerales bacterium]|nr:hypothetical protein [Sedimentisphaerales bacterium]
MTEEKDNRSYNCVYGAVCFAGRNHPGCGVVIGESQEHRFDKPEFHLIAEVEDHNTRELIQACSGLDLQYLPHLWFGDTDDAAGRRFIDGLNEELERKYQLPGVISRKLKYQRHRGTMQLTKSAVIEMAEPFQYILPVLKGLLSKEKRRLFIPPSSAVIGYLKVIETGDIANIRISDFPAVSALGIAVIELENRPDLSDSPVDDEGWDEWRD